MAEPLRFNETPPLLIALPHGLNVSGVTMWAVRLANAIATQKSDGTGDRAQSPSLASHSGVGLVLHREPDGHSQLPLEISPHVAIFDARHLPPVEEVRGDLQPFLEVYRNAVRKMASRFGGPVVLSPNLHGDFYGIGARLSQTEDIRVIAWQHSDIEYNTRLAVHYEQVISRFIAVSEHIATSLKQRLAPREADVSVIHCGVPVAPNPIRKDQPVDRTVRLIYTGRISHEQKRVGMLVDLSDELERRGLAHRLTLVGDGPAADEIDAQIASRKGRMIRLPAATPDQVEVLLDQHDIFVLTSQYEGLSVSMLEAMAHGCVPVVTRVASGAAEVIDDGVNGLMTRASATDNEAIVIASLADAVERAISIGLPSLSQRAWETAKERFSIERHAHRVRQMLREVAKASPRSWPSNTAWAFTSERAEIGVGSGSVPADGAARMKQALDALADRSVVIYGAGEHTRQLAHIIEASPIKLVAIADDDPGKQGTKMLGVSIIAPSEIAETGAADVVLSSWMNEEPMYKSAATHAREHAALHRLYEESSNDRST